MEGARTYACGGTSGGTAARPLACAVVQRPLAPISPVFLTKIVTCPTQGTKGGFQGSTGEVCTGFSNEKYNCGGTEKWSTDVEVLALLAEKALLVLYNPHTRDPCRSTAPHATH